MIKIITKKEILNIQKNKEPFLMMDEIQLISDEEVIGKKNFDDSFWVFKYHWPGDPNVPAVFQTEALTQISSMIILSNEKYHNYTFLVVMSDKLKFKRKITPNETLVVKSRLMYFNRGVAKFKAEGTVSNEFCCSGEFTMVLQEEISKFNKD
tara:strand:+ start:687 stop:1142 length:456 start_codon:yes stop_codon:yes gene_type:complete